jgi:hypothetical protein
MVSCWLAAAELTKCFSLGASLVFVPIDEDVSSGTVGTGRPLSDVFCSSIFYVDTFEWKSAVEPSRRFVGTAFEQRAGGCVAAVGRFS